MLFACVLLTSIAPLACIKVKAEPFSKPQYGPLYKSVKLLIEEESIYASHLWNETLYQINDYAYLVQDAIDTYNTKQTTIYDRLDEISTLEKPPIYRKCFKKYEREVAHFTQELYAKYDSCQTSLIDVMDTFEFQILEEAKFMITAAEQIEDVGKFCKISQLQRRNGNQNGIVLCVLMRIAAINQRLDRISELSVDLLLNLVVESDDNGDNVDKEESAEFAENNFVGDLLTDNCLDYNDLYREFELVYAQILVCQDNDKLNWLFSNGNIHVNNP